MPLNIVPDWVSVPSSWTLIAIVTIALPVLVTAIIRRLKYVKHFSGIPGLHGALPILGNSLLFANFNPEELFSLISSVPLLGGTKQPIMKCWIGPFPLVFIYSAHAFEIVLSSNKLIEKSREYDFLHPWLNTGLLTSTGSKWQTRRKLLTPTFHFKILEDFIQVFNEQSVILVNQLKKTVQKKKDLNIYPFITHCTLDIICETAMGCHVSAQTSQENSTYIDAVYAMSRIVQARQTTPWLQPNFLFNLSPYGAEQRKSLEILHGFTLNVIRERKLEHKQQQVTKSAANTNDDDFVSKKKRLAFLDLLIDASDDGNILNDSDIREEVDTFMFEGHDTTTAGINWSLFLIGSHPKVQELVKEELDRVFGDSNRPVSMADLSELKYLECCIKEALRLFPPVPFMGRKLSEDTTIHGFNIPANTTIFLETFSLHRDPDNFPDPELFQPERFYPENIRGRHPYAYVPFSAGARNCIGQKFALMEEKIILSSILRNFHIESLDNRDELILLGELILRPRDGINLRLTPKS